jgi:hypothetical protein
MTENIVPPWRFEANCPQCGEKIGLKRESETGPIEIKGDERLFCPVHGDVMSVEEARRVALDSAHDDIIDKARKFAIDGMRGKLTS